MGYRSEVTIQVALHHKLPLLEAMSEHWSQWKAITHLEDDEHYTIIIDDVKWYDSYPSVNKVTSFIENLPDEMGGIVCIGENDETWDYGMPWNVGLHRYVIVEGVTEEESADGSSILENFEDYKQKNPELFI